MTILQHLYQIEQQNSVRILLAVESGSRMWGFESKDSDYDVRYIYVGTPSRYITVSPVRDVIEGPADNMLDLSGWDLKKALHLMSKSNPCLYEWLSSPIVYLATDRSDEFRRLARDWHSAREGMFHYLGMCAHNYREHMRNGAAPSVRLKKYLYICRPLLCCRWLERNPHAGPPPMNMMQLMLEDKALFFDVCLELEQLILRKRDGDELIEGPAVPVLNAWIDSEKDRLFKVAHEMPPRQLNADPAKLDQFLRECVL